MANPFSLWESQVLGQVLTFILFFRPLSYCVKLSFVFSILYLLCASVWVFSSGLNFCSLMLSFIVSNLSLNTSTEFLILVMVLLIAFSLVKLPVPLSHFCFFTHLS